MTWVWYFQPITDIDPAEFDYKSPVQKHETHLGKFIDVTRGPVRYHARRSDFVALQQFHCPPVGAGPPLVDEVWQRIIRKFVPEDRIQFYPAEIWSGKLHTAKYSWVLPLDQVRCIDIERSNITSKIERPDITLIISCDYYVHLPARMGASHIARDEQQTTHLIVSDQLRDALAATGEASMFYRPENLPLLAKRQLH